MARPLRLEHPDAVWHITSRGNNHQDIYLDDDDRLLFLSILGDAVRRFGWLVHAFGTPTGRERATRPMNLKAPATSRMETRLPHSPIAEPKAQRRMRTSKLC